LCSLVAVEGMEQSAVQNRLKPAPQTLQLEGVSRGKLNLDPMIVDLTIGDPTLGGFLSGNRQPVSATSTPEPSSQRGDVKSVPPVPQPASSTAPANPPSDAKRTTAGCGWPISKAQGRRGTTHPKAVPTAVRDWSGAGHRTGRQRGFLIAPTSSSL